MSPVNNQQRLQLDWVTQLSLPTNPSSLAKPTWLILIPTNMELEMAVNRFLTRWQSDPRCHFAVCGFGPIAAAANAARLIDRLDPQHVMLLGIAGGYRDEIAIGEATAFDEVGCYGIGVGEGARFRPAQSIGWKHCEGGQDSPAIGDRIELENSPARGERPETRRLLLTVTSASDNSVEVAHRLEHFPTALAEDMEGFGVALACRLANTPLQIVRGISNRAGDRNKSNWRIPAALESAANLAEHFLEKQA